MKYSIFLFLLGACFFISCDKKEKCDPNPDATCACTLEYDPVCGCDNVTYGNPCAAECSNIFNYTKGVCK